MLNNGILYLKRRSLSETFTYLIFFMPFFLSFFQDFIGIPSFIKYTIDICWLGALVFLLFVKRAYVKKEIAPIIIIVSVFFVIAFIAYLFNFQSPFYFLWGVRNNLRFYIAFLAFTTFFDSKDVDICMSFLDKIFWLNIVVTFIQFFVLGYSQDYLGGIFGIEKGCNAYMIVFFSIVVVKSIVNFFNDKESALLCFAKCGITMIISVMAELKVFFLMFVIVLIVASIITKFSWKKVVLYIISFFFLMLAGIIMVGLFGESSNLNIDNIIDLIFKSHYSTARDLGRMTALPTISKYYLTEPLERMFGMGLGNCDTSTFEICNTPFYRAHSYLHYTWLSSAFLFLETGYIGLALFLLFFVAVFILAYRKSKQEESNKTFCQMAMIMAIMCIILTFYNSSLRTETGYMAYFVLALPFVATSKETVLDNQAHI